MKQTTLLILVVCLLLPGCDDDPAVPDPEAITVTVRVRDAAGEPVEGLALSLVSDNDYLQDKAGAKARNSVNWVQPVTARVTLSIEDIEGALISVLVDDERPPGVHMMHWAGTDSEGTRLPSGRYTVRMVAWDDGDQKLFEQTRDMLMAVPYVAVGHTDANGEARLTDRRLFPHLYGLPAMTAVSEDGTEFGEFSPTEAMRFYLTDDPMDGEVRYDVEVTAAGGVFDLVWQAREPRPVRSGQPPFKRDADPVDLPTEFILGQPYPNPFN